MGGLMHSMERDQGSWAPVCGNAQQHVWNGCNLRVHYIAYLLAV
jgi:hypothetical protein